jgi:hypothetical protein
MSAIWESANWTRQFGIWQTGNRQFRYAQNNLHQVRSKSKDWKAKSFKVLGQKHQRAKTG